MSSMQLWRVSLYPKVHSFREVMHVRNTATLVTQWHKHMSTASQYHSTRPVPGNDATCMYVACDVIQRPW
jgi:hypothetical protein